MMGYGQVQRYGHGARAWGQDDRDGFSQGQGQLPQGHPDIGGRRGMMRGQGYGNGYGNDQNWGPGSTTPTGTPQ